MSPSASISDFLVSLGEDLDIPNHLHEDAVLKYQDVGEWLAAEGSGLNRYSPEIYPQGSFRFGTVVRPLSPEHEYDIDLVCHLNIEKESVTQSRLKEMIGERLRGREDLAKILTSSRRCWNLTYPTQFHMDVLPAIPNKENHPTAILLTDTDLRGWQHSN